MRRDGREAGWVFLAGDPLRGLAALGVVTLHAAGGALLFTGYADSLGGGKLILDAYGTVLGSVLAAGYLGLWVFFVLSGYLIGRPFVAALIEGRPLPSIRRYARNRALRILPAYWTVLAVVMVVFVWILGRAQVSPANVVKPFLLDLEGGGQATDMIGQAWSLVVEAKFYVVLPIAALLAAFALRGLHAAHARALAIAVPAAGWTIVAPFVVDADPGSHAFVYFLRLFAAGLALAALEPLLRPRVEGRRVWIGVATASVVTALLYVLAAPALYDLVGAPFDQDVGLLVADVALITLIAAPLLRQWVDGGCWRALDNRVNRWLGSRSYSLFLVNLLVMLELARALAEPGDGYKVTLAWLLPATFAVSAVLAEVLHRAVERPFLARKRPTAVVPTSELSPPPVLLDARSAQVAE